MLQQFQFFEIIIPKEKSKVKVKRLSWQVEKKLKDIPKIYRSEDEL
jgi:hypothetical protein